MAVGRMDVEMVTPAQCEGMSQWRMFALVGLEVVSVEAWLTECEADATAVELAGMANPGQPALVFRHDGERWTEHDRVVVS